MKTFKLSLRTLVHYKLYSIINLLGLALSLTCVVIISRYVYSELTVDGFNQKLDRIFISTMELANNPGVITYSGIYDLHQEQDFVDISKHPGVEKHSLFIIPSSGEITLDNQSYDANMLITDTVFLQILDYRVIVGTGNIRRPEDAIITETFAAKIFGKENPIGKTLFSPTINKTVTIAGIIRTPPNKSVLSFDILMSLQLDKYWHSYGRESLILLYPGVDYRDVNRRHNEFIEMSIWKLSIRYQLFPYRDIYFDRRMENDYGMFAHGNITYIFILSSIGGLLLLIGLINYINIHAVVTIRRSKELGMKKVFGAGGGSIFAQLLVENLLLIVVSLILAFWFAAALQPFVENTFGIRQYPNLRFDILLSLVIIVMLPVAVSIAPYLRYQYSSPIRSLRSMNAGNKSLFSRKFFLVFQYFMTIGLIVVSLFFVKQLDFMMNKDLGYRTKNIISIPFFKYVYIAGNYQEVMNKRNATIAILEQKLNESTLLEYWSYGDFPLVNYEREYRIPGGELQKTTCIYADKMWLKIFGIQLLEGELWNDEIEEIEDYSADFIVSESTLKQFGITNYRDAELCSSLEFIGTTKGVIPNPPDKIIGVVKDFYTAHLSKRLAPIVIERNPKVINGSESIIVSFAPERRQEILKFMKNLHSELVGGEFTYSFIEDEIAKLYSEDKKVALICTVFTGIAILISMLGLFGISLFDIRQRRKEIAIRKINGAQIIDILRLLLKKYFVLLGVAFVVATPVALLVIYKYLENFANKAPISWWLFAVALFVTVAVSLLTLIYQTYKAGNENPAEVIKSDN